MTTDLSPDILADYAHHLGKIFQENRVKHQRHWEKIFYDRIYKLLPDLDETDVFWVVNKAIELGILETCKKLEKDTDLERLAVKLVKFVYIPSR